jgi:hypothetical protein
MSALLEKSRRWRRLGLLKYLAVELGVTVKQVTRYWDQGWIPGGYRTPGGARRICYDDHTVQQVRQIVQAIKETNREIRYRLEEINYGEVKILVKGCNSMDDLFKRAQVRLGKRKAANLAYSLRLQPRVSSEQVAWDSLRAKECTSEEEARQSLRYFDWIPLSKLVAAKDAPDFQRIAERVWMNIQSDLQREAPSQTIAAMRHLLSRPDRQSFIAEWNKVTEVDNRIMNRTDNELRNARAWATSEPHQARLHLAALLVRRSQQSPSASALAKVLQISRPALYRTFGRDTIQTVLKSIRHDPLAAETTRNELWAEGKTNERGRRTTLTRHLGER